MNDEPKGRVAAGVLAAHVVCCGGIILVVTGALSGVGAWLLDGGLAWIGLVAIVAAAGYFLRPPRERPACAAPLEPAAPETQSRRSKAA